MDRTTPFIDIAEDMDADHARSARRDSIRHRTSADVMRTLGIPDERIIDQFGYLPEPMDAPSEPAPDQASILK